MANYNAAVLADGPQQVFRLNETSGIAIVDAMAHGNGTFSPAFPASTTGALVASGDLDAAITFNGTTQYGSIPRQIQDDFTIEFWFKASSTHDSGDDWFQASGLVGGDVSGVTNDFGCSIDKDGGIRCGIGNPNITKESSQKGFNDNAWHYVVFTRVRSTGKFILYVDGVLQAQGTGNTKSLTAPSNLAIASTQLYNPTQNLLAGAVDEVATYTYAFTLAQVQAHYNAGTTAPPPPGGGPAGGYTQPTISLVLGSPGFWSVVLCDYTGKAIGELRDLHDWKIVFVHNNQTTMQFRVRDDNPFVIPLIGLNCRLKTYDPAGYLRLHAELLSCEPQGDAQQAGLTALAGDSMFRMRKRLLGKTAAGYSKGTAASPVDRGLIAADIINTINADGDSFLRVGGINATASTFVGPLYFKPASDAIIDLSAPLDGIDFQIVPTEPTKDATGLQIAKFTCGPAIGAAAPDIIFEYGQGQANIIGFNSPITLEGAANSWWALPPNYPQNGAQLPFNSYDGAAAAQWGLLEDVVPSSDIVDDKLRQALAQEYLRIRKQPRQTIAFQPGMDAPQPFVDYALGDTVRARINFAGYTFIDALMRVFAIELDIDVNGKVTVVPHLVDDTRAAM